MFLTDARELGAREVADALLVKLPKKINNKKSNKSEEKPEKRKKALCTVHLAVTSQCRTY